MKSDESGLTLVEILVTVVLLGIVVVANSTLLIVTMRVNSETNTGISGARSTQLTVAYFNDDMQDATAAVTSGSQSCGAGDSLKIEISGTTFAAGSSTPVAVVISYVTRPVTVGGITRTALHRLLCLAPSTTPTTDSELDTLISSSPAGDGATCVTATAPVGTRSCALIITPCPPAQLLVNPVPKCTTTNPGTPVVPTTTYSVSGTTRTTP